MVQSEQDMSQKTAFLFPALHYNQNFFEFRRDLINPRSFSWVVSFL